VNRGQAGILVGAIVLVGCTGRDAPASAPGSLAVASPSTKPVPASASPTPEATSLMPLPGVDDHGPATVPSGSQAVHVVVDGDTVRLEPATVRAGEVYLVFDDTGWNVMLIERSTAPEATNGPLSDDELDRVVHGDLFHTGRSSGFATVSRLVLAQGKDLVVTGDPVALAEKNGGVIPQDAMAVLRVLP